MSGSHSRPRYGSINLPRAMAAVRRLGLDPCGPVVALAEATVAARCNTQTSAERYAQGITKLLRFLGERGVDPITASRDDLLAYKVSLSGYAPGFRRNQLAIAYAFYEEAIERDLATRNPARRLRRRTPDAQVPTPALTKAQAEMVLGAIADDFGDPRHRLVALRDYAILLVGVRLMLRLFEMVNLRCDDIVERDGRRELQLVGKGEKLARLPVPDDVWDAIVAWQTEYTRVTGRRFGPDDPVLTSVSRHALRAQRLAPGAPRPMSPRRLQAMVTQRMADVGISGPRYGAHALRATGATLANEAGVTLAALQAAMRHANPATTARYIRRTEEQIRIVVESIRLDPALAGTGDNRMAGTP